MTTETIAKLAALYPKTFFAVPEDRRPLKIGIDRDLAGAKIMTRALKRTLRFYTRSVGYLTSMIEGAMRLDLNGDPVDPVSAQAAAHAVELLDAHHKHWRVALSFARKQNGNGAGNGAAPATETTVAAPPPPKKITLADLRAAARSRQAATQ